MTLAALTALAVIAFRLILFYTGRSSEGIDFLIVHFFALVTIVFFTDNRLLARDARASFPALMREGFKSAAVYALIWSAFIWIYYAGIDPDHLQGIVDRAVADGLASGGTEEVVRPRVQKLFTPFNNASITFFGLLVVGAMLALFVGVVHHKLLRRLRR